MDRRITRRQSLRVVALATVAGLTAAACGADPADPTWQNAEKTKGPEMRVSVTGPAASAKNVPTSAEVTYTTENATSATVELKEASGNAVSGAMRADGTSWLPAGQLKWGTTYTVTVTAKNDKDSTATATSTFTTMAKPGNLVRITSNIGDGNVVGVGMPLVLRFGRGVPKSTRAAIQRRLFAEATPAQEGAWHWFSDSEVHYRPKAYWKPGTKLNFRVLTGGVPMGGNWYGQRDLTIDNASIGSALIMTVDNRTHMMTVTKDGKVLKTIPVSLGKPKTPSSSGTMVVMEKLRKTVFDTTSAPDPADRYKIDIEYAQRLTWSGQYVHAAPWSEDVQGRSNVSHGCVNVSQNNAAWLFSITKVGDPVTVKGTEEKLQYGNGWTDWSLSWDEYIKGSAIPYEAPTAPNPSPSAEPSPSP
ncbi:MAG TPA: Ig-like domain-containing protein [Micromonosporaceae bacterium]|nr:Ig-like domain-containing protein [Micromonosporaceae bacterium]